MKKSYAGSVAEGDKVSDVFALRSKELRSSRNGEAYLALELSDRTGRLAAVMFRPDRLAQALPAGSVVAVEGTATTYRGVLRVSVERLRLAGKWDATDLLPTSPRDRDELLARLRELVRGIRDPHLAKIVRVVFGDRTFMQNFKRCPGAQSYHHAYIAGLLEHTVAVATLCEGMASMYADVNHDLLVAGALLHDIGKVDELTCTTGIDYTDEGRFIGHVVLGEERLRRVLDRLGDVPSSLRVQLSHMMLSHHGELEWGSPKRPCTLEALILHHADNMDAKAAGFVETAAAAVRAEEQWTDASNAFHRPLYAPQPAEDDSWVRSVDGGRYIRRGA
ncbi:MAG: 3'-5' exoribonuclease YhaM family protein [Coriobacteriia bacterium]|nr:3'-5' exoribonuclease YhaM family protein [Coriobacteriia bacterium]MBN2822931.1 3'-5' exoribonuclease YhaM family protein [Coriobacteriia bacterium]